MRFNIQIYASVLLAVLVFKMVLEVALTELLATFWAGNLDRTLVLVLGDLLLRALLPVLAHAVSQHVASTLKLVVAAALPAHEKMSNAQVEYVIQKVKEFFEGTK